MRGEPTTRMVHVDLEPTALECGGSVEVTPAGSFVCHRCGRSTANGELAVRVERSAT